MSIKTYLMAALPMLALWDLSMIWSIVLLLLARAAIRRDAQWYALNCTMAAVVAMSSALYFLYNPAHRAERFDAQGGVYHLVYSFFVAGLSGVSFLLGAFATTLISRSQVSRVPTRFVRFAYRGTLAFCVCGVMAPLVTESDSIAMTAASSPYAPVSDLNYLYHKGERANSSGIMLFLAQNTHAPTDMLTRMSYSRFDHVRVWVTKNPRTTTEVLERLAQDQNHFVREFAAQALQQRFPIVIQQKSTGHTNKNDDRAKQRYKAKGKDDEFGP